MRLIDAEDLFRVLANYANQAYDLEQECAAACADDLANGRKGDYRGHEQLRMINQGRKEAFKNACAAVLAAKVYEPDPSEGSDAEEWEAAQRELAAECEAEELLCGRV